MYVISAEVLLSSFVIVLCSSIWKESELWHSLGEVWYVPQEDWNDHVPSYRPVFTDGGGGGPPTHQAQGNNYNSNGNSAYDRHHQEPPEQGNKDSTFLWNSIFLKKIIY